MRSVFTFAMAAAAAQAASLNLYEMYENSWFGQLPYNREEVRQTKLNNFVHRDVQLT